MKVSEKVDTTFGQGVVKLVVCDLCGKKEALIAESAYDLNDGWHQLMLTQFDDKSKSYPKKTTWEFCSQECVVRHLAPGLLDRDPMVVQAAINSLKRIEQDLQPSG